MEAWVTRLAAPLVAQAADVAVPDLRGFGESDKHPADLAAQYSAAALGGPGMP